MEAYNQNGSVLNRVGNAARYPHFNTDRLLPSLVHPQQFSDIYIPQPNYAASLTRAVVRLHGGLDVVSLYDECRPSIGYGVTPHAVDHHLTIAIQTTEV